MSLFKRVIMKTLLIFEKQPGYTGKKGKNTLATLVNRLYGLPSGQK